MMYKTITMKLLEANPEECQSLRRSRQLLPTLNRLATELRANHLACMNQLRQAHPDMDPQSIEGSAMEMAVARLQEHLSSPDSETTATV